MSYELKTHSKYFFGQLMSSLTCRSVVSTAVFTLYQIVKRSAAESAPGRASVHTRDAAFEAVSAPEQNCSVPLLKVERFVSDRFLKWSEPSLNSFFRAKHATEPRIGKRSFQIKRERCKSYDTTLQRAQ